MAVQILVDLAILIRPLGQSSSGISRGHRVSGSVCPRRSDNVPGQGTVFLIVGARMCSGNDFDPLWNPSLPDDRVHRDKYRRCIRVAAYSLEPYGPLLGGVD